MIKSCYWPLIHMAEQNIPIGIEASAVTLEIIDQIDPEWIVALKRNIQNKQTEFIGSGYAQLIGPLVPSDVNRWNQKLGLDVYEELLGVKPSLVLVNEMAYSGGMASHYHEVGYDGIIMEWNNPRSAHPEWENEWRYFPQKAIGTGGETIPLIWADSIAFQKFQRFVHGEFTLTEFTAYLQGQASDSDRYFPLYSNDVEIFNYRPGRYSTEAHFGENDEWKRIIELYKYLDQQEWCELVYPSQVLGGMECNPGGNSLKLESASQPIPVKKQVKYNINRWALTGRDDLNINTTCYQKYSDLVNSGNQSQDVWIELCYQWSSDFRTHITMKRWREYKSSLTSKKDHHKMFKAPSNWDSLDLPHEGPTWHVYQDSNHLSAQSRSLKVMFNMHKGMTINACTFKAVIDQPLFGTLDHGYYDDISLGADFFSGHSIIEIPGQHKITDLAKVSPRVLLDEVGSGIQIEAENSSAGISSMIMLEGDVLSIHKHLRLSNGRRLARVHPLIFTLNEQVWDQNTLFYATQNGHESFERHLIKNRQIDHSQSFSLLISAENALGATGGIVEIGDSDKILRFQHDPQQAALIPFIVYRPMPDGKALIRLMYSAREIDETFMENSNVKEDEIWASVQVTASQVEE